MRGTLSSYLIEALRCVGEWYLLECHRRHLLLSWEFKFPASLYVSCSCAWSWLWSTTCTLTDLAWLDWQWLARDQLDLHKMEGIACLYWDSRLTPSWIHGPSNSRSLCAEETNYSPAQPTSVAVSLCNLFFVLLIYFFYLPFSSGRRNVLFVGEM